ncbi:hypothetical protein [Mesorhizobium sp. M0478]|uniref:hypothetical protein n=1 Tax=Mesorhizobium sp. M0478 TaxID=2956947 RepID=UPI003336CA65
MLQDQRHLLDEDEIRWRLERVVERTRVREPWSDRRRLQAQLKGDKALVSSSPYPRYTSRPAEKTKELQDRVGNCRGTASHW